LLDTIKAYRGSQVPLIVPLTLIKHYVRKYEVSYLARQVFLSPFPDIQPPADVWKDVEIPFTSFQPLLLGKQPAGIPPLDPGAIRTFGLIIASRQASPFRLELEWMKCY
jgi:hypothetical protein